MRRYHFHAVGRDGAAVFDPTGRWLSSLREVRRQADSVALTLMDTAGADWSAWVMDVRDTAGRSMLMRAFAPGEAYQFDCPNPAGVGHRP